MGKVIIGIVIGLIVIAIIAVIIILVLKKKKNKSNQRYMYEGDDGIINVQKIDDIDTKYRNDGVNLSTSFDTNTYEDTSYNDNNFNEFDSLDDVETLTTDNNQDELEVLDEEEKTIKTICDQCGSSLINANGYCPGCGKPL